MTASSDNDNDNDYDALEVAVAPSANRAATSASTTATATATATTGEDDVAKGGTCTTNGDANIKQRRNNNDKNKGDGNNNNSSGDDDDGDDGDGNPNGGCSSSSSSSKPPYYVVACWKCWISLRNCTGIFIVLGIVNFITVLLLSGIGYMLGAILDHAGSTGSTSSSTRYRHNDDTLDMIGIIISQFCCLGMNLLALYCLCKRFNSNGRDYKAAVAAFGCCCCCLKEQRKIYPEAIRPIRDVVADIWNSVPILFHCCNCSTFFKAIGFLILGLILCERMYWSNQAELLVYVCLFSCLVWISVGVFIWKINDGFDPLRPIQELDLQQQELENHRTQQKHESFASSSSSPQKEQITSTKEVEILQVV